MKAGSPVLFEIVRTNSRQVDLDIRDSGLPTKDTNHGNFSAIEVIV
jgi:hypothetical protein